MTELKHLYTAKLRQVSQQSQRSQRNLQLQLYKVQQERNRLQEELDSVRLECQTLKSQSPAGQSQNINPQLEETQWEVCLGQNYLFRALGISDNFGGDKRKK